MTTTQTENVAREEVSFLKGELSKALDEIRTLKNELNEIKGMGAQKGLLLSVENLVVSFDGFRAVDGLNLYVEHNQLHGVIGPNGAGKSTLLDAICGKNNPASGSIRFKDHELTKMSEHEIVLSGVGRKFQTPSIYEELTVFENLEISLPKDRNVFGSLFWKRDDEVIGKIMTVAEDIFLSGLLDTQAGLLSHGQKQWLEIGMLLIQDPELLLLDEPVAGMSVSERQKTAELLKRIRKDRSLVVIEHDLKFIEDIADRVTVLHQGKWLSEGKMEHVKNDPKVVEVYVGH